MYGTIRRPAALPLLAALALGLGLALGLPPATGSMARAGGDPPYPAYSVLSRDGDFEIRDYAPLVVARHSMRGTYRQAVNEGYIRLERYFTRENSVPEAMKIAPPIMVRDDLAAGWTMMLALPPEYRVETAPRPLDRRVEVVELPRRRVAVVKFRGRVGERAMRAQVARLKAWLAGRGLAHRADFTMASYDPPWKPASMRRAEILVTLR